MFRGGVCVALDVDQRADHVCANRTSSLIGAAQNTIKELFTTACEACIDRLHDLIKPCTVVLRDPRFTDVAEVCDARILLLFRMSRNRSLVANASAIQDEVIAAMDVECRVLARDALVRDHRPSAPCFANYQQCHDIVCFSRGNGIRAAIAGRTWSHDRRLC